MLDGFEAALFSDAAGAELAALIGHRAGADDRASAEETGFRGMGDQLRERERHILARVRCAELLAVERNLERPVQPCAIPCSVEFVGRHGNRRKCGCWL